MSASRKEPLDEMKKFYDSTKEMFMYLDKMLVDTGDEALAKNLQDIPREINQREVRERARERERERKRAIERQRERDAKHREREREREIERETEREL